MRASEARELHIKRILENPSDWLAPVLSEILKAINNDRRYCKVELAVAYETMPDLRMLVSDLRMLGYYVSHPPIGLTWGQSKVIDLTVDWSLQHERE